MTRLVVCSFLLCSLACSSRESGTPNGAGGTVPETGGSPSKGGTADGGSKGGGAGEAIGFGGTPEAGGTEGTGGLAGSDGAAGADGGDAGLARMFTERTSPVTGDLDFLATSGDVIVAAGTRQLIYSDDGVTWKVPEPPVEALSVAFGGGTFVALGEMGMVFTSSDGRTWTSATPFTPTAALDRVTYAFGKFFAVGYSLSGTSYQTSPDGVTWTSNRPKFSSPSTSSSDWTNMTWTLSAGDWVYMSANWSQAGHNFGSKDGITWEIIGDWTSLTYDVAYDGKTYCSVGAYSGGASKDGKSWTTTGAGLRSVIPFGGVFFAVGGFGAVRASRDCVTWGPGAEPGLPDHLPNNVQAGLEAIRVHQDRLVVVGDGGRIYTSP